MADWTTIQIGTKMFENVAETVLTRAQAAIENAFVNEAEGQSRFPGLAPFADLGGNAPVYLDDWQGDLVAVMAGRLYRIDANKQIEDVTGVPVSGGLRPVFDKTPDELLIAAGGPIVRFAGQRTEILSEDAPLASHVGYIGGYVVAAERDSGYFYHSQAQEPRLWDALDIFAATGKPDNINSLLVTKYEELLVSGVDSIEQYERLQTGGIPFFRRWSVGSGVHAPYTMVEADNAAWAVNSYYEFVRFSGQISESASGDIQKPLEKIDDWTEAWAERLDVLGQRFIVLQMPRASNIYGTKGVTLLYEYRRKRWHALYGWDATAFLPGRWPGWSIRSMWGRVFVGCNGKICELTDRTYSNDGALQRMLGRTAHLTGTGQFRVDNVRALLARGTGQGNQAAQIAFRCRKDNGRWTPFVTRPLGVAGDSAMTVQFGGFGWADSFQFEWEITGDAPVEFRQLQWQTTEGRR